MFAEMHEMVLDTSYAEKYDTVSLFGVRFACITESQSVDWICDRAESAHGAFIVTANLDHLRRCCVDPSYRAIVEDANLVVADGMPLIWASKIQGAPLLPERVAGSSMTISLCEIAASRGLSIYLLGGDEGVAERAAGVLRERYPKIQVAGYHCPPFGFEKSKEQIDVIRDGLASTSPDIVLVALGSPKQEKLIHEMRSVCPKACWIGVGISLSFITGDVVRAPEWVQKAGIEWLHRLIQEPKRLFRRYVIQGIPWGLRLMAHSTKARMKKTR
ncbi:MAG: glycosyltransferase [Phycisphaerae bacterium]|nr:glycosyltransferase [Phycisphaerae bacterium]MBM91467.1 glycosyltransferase [Phycisphaerae bacterium]MBM92664.1 glycosyltransferase [Phycisphaerae bacterium]